MSPHERREVRTYDLASLKSVRFAPQTIRRLRLQSNASNASNASKPCRRHPSRSVYHLAIKPISRSAGRSATAAAAYRAGSLVIDERTGEVHDYTRKSDIEHSEILVPAGSPAWATERVALWNAAEAAEKRKDARVARDYEVAIPKELTREQGIALVRDFAHRLVDAYGVAVDFNVHRDELRNWDGSEKGWQGYHAHLLTSTRRFGREGFGEKASIELSDTKRKSLGLRDGAAEISRVREWWEIDANRHLEQANQAERIDRRSLKDQGIDREPTVHLGPAVTLLERDGVPSRLGALNRQIVAEATTRLAQQREVSELRVQIQEVEARQAAERKEADAAREAEKTVEPVKPTVRTERPREATLQPGVRPDSAEALERAIRERDERVRRVLAKAEQRETRRREAGQALLRAAPAAPKGVLAAFQKKGHQQALAAWTVAKEVAATLVEQARQLVRRLKEIAAPERILAWSRAKVEEVRTKPAPAAEGMRDQFEERSRSLNVADSRPARDRPTNRPLEATRPLPSRKPNYTDLSISDQVKVFKLIVERLQADRLAKLSRVEHKALKRHERREFLAERVAMLRPAEPRGLLAGFKQKDHEHALQRWRGRSRYVNRLAEQSGKLTKRLEEAKAITKVWALQAVERKEPGFFKSVQAHFEEQQRKWLEEQRAEREINRQGDKNRGRER